MPNGKLVRRRKYPVYEFGGNKILVDGKARIRGPLLGIDDVMRTFADTEEAVTAGVGGAIDLVTADIRRGVHDFALQVG